MYLGDNLCDFVFSFLHMKPLLKRVYSKRKEFAPKGSKFFPFRVDLFSEWRQKPFRQELPPLKVHPFTFRILQRSCKGPHQTA